MIQVLIQASRDRQVASFWFLQIYSWMSRFINDKKMF